MVFKDLPTLSRKQMIEVDHLMITKIGISLIQMMENAGRNLAELTRNNFLNGNISAKKIIILAGSGGNGGGALVAARHLVNWGADVSVYLGKPLADYSDVPFQQLQILKNMKVKIYNKKPEDDLPRADVILDGLIGYNLDASPRGRVAKMIEWASHRGEPIISLDVPSGLDVDTGIAHKPTVKASATMTLALPKTGLLSSQASDYVGDLYLADISVPEMIYKKLGIEISEPNIFKEKSVIQL